MDTKNVERLYKANYRQLYLTARGILGDDEESRDAVNEAFTRLLRTKTNVADGDELRFLIVCVRNICLNTIKHKDVHERFVRMCFCTTYTDNSDDSHWKDVADEAWGIVNYFSQSE